MTPEELNNADYKLLTFTALNNVASTQEFDFNLIRGKRLVIKRIAFKWYQKDNIDGYPYKGSRTTIDGLVTEHEIHYTNAEKAFIPEDFAANKNQAGNCILNFTINNKPIYLNGKMDNLYLKEDNLNLSINEPVQDFVIKVTNALMIFLKSDGTLNESDNLGWVCEVGCYVL